MLTKSNPCYITVSATLVLLGVELTMPRPRLFSVLIFSTKHISLRREQSSKHYCLGSKRPAKVLIVTPLPLRITVMNSLTLCPDLKNLAVFTPFNTVMFYSTFHLRKNTQPNSLYLLRSLTLTNSSYSLTYYLLLLYLLLVLFSLSPHPTPTLSQI